jgi:hypothetical protein
MCSVDGCEKPHTAKGLCNTHYMRQYRGGSLDAPVRRYGVTSCSVDGCEKKAHSRGWCPMHWQRWRKKGEVGGAEHLIGDRDTYGAAHHRLYAAKGPAKDHMCVDCEGPAMEWCYDGGCEDERVGKNGRFDVTYCPHPEHYTPRCASCHRRHDREVRTANVDPS